MVPCISKAYKAFIYILLLNCSIPKFEKLRSFKSAGALSTTNHRLMTQCKLQHRSPVWIIINQICLYVHHSTEAHYRQQFLTSNILYSTTFYHLTRILTKTVWLTLEWSRYTLNSFVFFYLTPWRRTHEWPIHVGCLYITKLTFKEPKCICWSF